MPFPLLCTKASDCFFWGFGLFLRGKDVDLEQAALEQCHLTIVKPLSQ